MFAFPIVIQPERRFRVSASKQNRFTSKSELRGSGVLIPQEKNVSEF
jgi:hypothetical protein